MMRKTLIATAAFVGLAVAGTVASATPASAGYACGPWNGWCRYYAPPSFSFGWYGGRHYGKPYGYRHYGHNNWRGGNKYYRGGGNKKHAYKHNRNKRHR